MTLITQPHLVPDFLICLSIIVCNNENIPEAYLNEYYCTIINKQAVALELIDKNNNWLKTNKQFELRLLQTFYDTAKNYPLLHDTNIFPNNTQYLLDFNQSHISFLKSRKEIDKTIDYDYIIKENQELQYIYTCVKYIHCKENGVFLIRSKLNLLRDILGYENYYSGSLPNPVQLKYFKYID